jgi:hypothetical protein
MAASDDYRKAYETARQELAELIASEEKLQKKKLSLRKTIETLQALCQSEGIAIEPSQEAAQLLEGTSLADEIRTVLKSRYPGWLRPNRVKEELERLGHDLSKYGNPQATIHMVLKRMHESGEAQEQIMPDDGKKAYRIPSSPVNSESRSLPNRTVTVSGRKK